MADELYTKKGADNSVSPVEERCDQRSVTQEDKKNPDGGYGWVVVIVSFLMATITNGITYTFGVLLVPLIKEFDANEISAAWVGSIQVCLMESTGLMSDFLFRRFGWRPVVIVGSIIACVGFVSSSFVTSIYPMYVTYGLLTGIGLGLVYCTSYIAIQHYFLKRRGLATGIALSGAGVGMCIFALISHHLVAALEWDWALRVLGGISMIGVICGALLKPPPTQSQKKTSKVIKTGASQAKPSASEDAAETCSSHLENCREIHHEVNDRKDDHISTEQRQTASHARTGIVTPVDVTHTYGPNTLEIQTITKSEMARNNNCFIKIGSALKHRMMMFTDPRFDIMIFSQFLFICGLVIQGSFIPERAIRLETVDSDKAAILMAVVGISNALGRVTVGFFGNWSSKLRIILAGGCLFIGGIAAVFSSYYTNFELLMGYSVVFGYTSGGWVALFPVIMVDLFGLEKLNWALGQFLAVGAVAGLVAPPSAGALIVYTDNINSAFWFCGGLEALGGAAVPVIFRLNKNVRIHDSGAAQ